MTTGLITPTKKQFKQFARLKEDAEARIAFTKDGMQQLLAIGGIFQDDYIALIKRYSTIDDRFELLNSFELTVPEGYNHGTQLAAFSKFAENKSEKFCLYNNNITDKNYAKATHRLIPIKTYGVKIFHIKKLVSPEDCLAFLVTQRAIFVGAQGLSLTRQLKKNEFPVGKWIVSLDEKQALWADVIGFHGVPGMYRHLNGVWDFGLGFFEGDYNDDKCLLCFYDLSA